MYKVVICYKPINNVYLINLYYRIFLFFDIISVLKLEFSLNTRLYIAYNINCLFFKSKYLLY